MEIGPHQEGQLCQDCPQGRPATIWGGRRIWMQYPRWFCRACWDEEYPAPVPGDRPPPLFQPPDAPPPKASQNKKAVHIKLIQQRGEEGTGQELPQSPVRCVGLCENKPRHQPRDPRCD